MYAKKLKKRPALRVGYNGPSFFQNLRVLPKGYVPSSSFIFKELVWKLTPSDLMNIKPLVYSWIIMLSSLIFSMLAYALKSILLY